MVEFCTNNGRGVCERCGAPCSGGIIQNCPSKRRYTIAVAKWERQRRTKPAGWGTLLAHALTAVGYTKARHLAIKKRLGLKAKCGCEKREVWLNKVGRRITG